MSHTDEHGGPARADGDGLIPPHGGYRNTRTFQLAELIYDVTVLFCDKFIDRHSRTHDQMVQAARSGSRNISEGCVDSATSKKIELKLTGIAKGSQEELLLDYQAFLRQGDLPKWPPAHPALTRFKARRCASLAEFRAWVADEVKRAAQHPEEYNLSSSASPARAGPCFLLASGSWRLRRQGSKSTPGKNGKSRGVRLGLPNW